MNILIRKVTTADAVGVTQVFNPIIETGRYTVFTEPFTPEAERKFIETMPDRGIFHVAVEQTEQRIVGFQVVSPYEDYTAAFYHVGVIGTYVDLNLHGQGIGGRLFEHTFTAAQANGFEKLFAFVRADNITGLTAYLKQGFQIIGTAHRQAKINGVYIDEVLIEKWLL